MINFNIKKIEQIARQIHKSIPKDILEFNKGIKKTIHQILQTQLMNFNLVNREEFDIQMQVLLRINEKLTLLEQRLTKLESLSTEESKQQFTNSTTEEA